MDVIVASESECASDNGLLHVNHSSEIVLHRQVSPASMYGNRVQTLIEMDSTARIEHSLR